MPDHVAQSERADLLGAQPEILQKWLVDVLTALVAVEIGHRRRNAIHDRAQLRFARGQGVLRLLQVGDIVADDVVALDGPVEAHVREDAVAKPPLPTIDIDVLALEGDALALGRAIDVRLLLIEDFGAEHLLHRLPDDFLARYADQMQKRVVDEGVIAFHVDVHHRLRNVVGEQPELLLAGGQRLLGQLEIVYVVFGAIQPPDLAGAIEVGRDAAVHPAPLAVGADADALVFDVLAFLRALDDRPQKRIDVVRHDVVWRLAVDLILRPAYPVGECLIDERVLELVVEIGDRYGYVVGEQTQLRFL